MLMSMNVPLFCYTINSFPCYYKMAGFKFSFSLNEDSEINEKNEVKHDEKRENCSTFPEWLEANEIIPTDLIIKDVDELFPKAKLLICGDLDIGHVFPEDAVNYLRENNLDNDLGSDVLQAESQHSDLLAGKYEGGLKIWECTNDLSEYFCKNEIDWKDKKVMDLGCGAGILGLIALLSGAKVHFQDYNKEVVNAVTIPNCLLNIQLEERETIKAKCKFFSGDWASLSKLMEPNIEDFKYDYILSSETIYNVTNHQKIFEFIKNHLKHGGTAYLAAKTYYFGVGGGIRQFESLVLKDSEMKCEDCWKSAGGVMREIIKLTFT